MNDAASTSEATAAADLELSSVNVEESGAATKTVTVEIPAKAIDQRIEANFALVQQDARLPGFRPGKAPRKLVERRFGKGVMEETRNRLVQDAFQKAIEGRKLRIVGNPVVKDGDKLQIESGRGLTVTYEVEVVPDFELPKLESIALRKPIAEVTTEMVDREMRLQQERRGQVVPVEGEAQPGDFFFGRALLIDAASGATLGTVAETISRMPREEDPDQGPMAGIRIEGLRGLLTGKKAGDTVTAETTGPENHELEAVRGTPIRIEFSIVNVGRLIPATVEQLMQMSGSQDEAQLRQRLEDAMRNQVALEQQDILRRQVAKHLIENTTMDLPKRASAAQAQRTLEQFRLRMLNQGIPAYLVEERMASIREASSERAQRDLKLMFIMERLCEMFDVKITEQEVNGRVVQIARQQNIRPEQLRNELIRSGRASMLVAQLRHEKAADEIIRKGSVTEVPREEWNQTAAAEDDEIDGGGVGDEGAEGNNGGNAEGSEKPARKTTRKKSTTKKAAKDAD